MSKKYVLMLTSVSGKRTAEEGFDAGDSIISEGVQELLPELKQFDMVFSANVPEADKEEATKNAHYIIVPGTPSWMHMRHRRYWEYAKKHKKHMAMLGVGMAMPYDGTFWDGSREFVELKDSGMIDLVVCRDRLCYFWLCQRIGFEHSKARVMPCPAFYTLVPKKVESKKNVVLGIANIEEVSHSCDHTFHGYYSRTGDLISELRAAGANVFISYQRNPNNYPGWIEFYKKTFPDYPMTWFPSWNDFITFHANKDVYIGVRNHGALPCAGAGMPALLQGTDYRQLLANEIPAICRLDISHTIWNVDFVMDWYNSLEPTGISANLINWRTITYARWRKILAPVIEALK